MNEGLTALEALGIAIRREIDAQRLFKDLAQRTENDLLKERFTNMVQEERRQQRMLEKKYNEMFPNVSLKIPPSQLPEDLFDTTPGRNIEIKDVLKIAMDEVKRGKEYYLDCAESTDDLSGRRMFRYLADMKLSHYMILNAELEMVEKYPAYYGNRKGWEVEKGLKRG